MQGDASKAESIGHRRQSGDSLLHFAFIVTIWHLLNLITSVYTLGFNYSLWSVRHRINSLLEGACRYFGVCKILKALSPNRIMLFLKLMSTRRKVHPYKHTSCVRKMQCRSEVACFLLTSGTQICTLPRMRKKYPAVFLQRFPAYFEVAEFMTFFPSVLTNVFLSIFPSMISNYPAPPNAPQMKLGLEWPSDIPRF